MAIPETMMLSSEIQSRPFTGVISREHLFVTSQGSAYARFRRALLTGNVLLVTAAARELPQISLDDARGGQIRCARDARAPAGP
jgi:hypothetical protein